MFLKQYNYKPRSNSQSSQGPASAAGSPPKGSPPKEESKIVTDTKAPAASAAVAGRRRSSATEKFAGLHAVKRSSRDERHESWAEQKTGQGGILGGMWQNFTKGSS